MNESRTPIAWWRLLIYVVFAVVMAFVFNALLNEVFKSQGWLLHGSRRGRTPIWIASLGLSLVAARMFDRVFPLVPGRKRDLPRAG
jgi:hypothetical protein